MSHNNLGVRGLTRYKSNMFCFCNSSNCFMANNYCEFCSLTLQNLLALYPVFLDEAQMGHDTPVHPEIRDWNKMQFLQNYGYIQQTEIMPMGIKKIQESLHSTRPSRDVDKNREPGKIPACEDRFSG